MNTIEILKAAKQLLIDKGWTQKAFARDSEGRKVRAYEDTATCFCGMGALRAARTEAGFAFFDAEQALADAALGEDSPYLFFDFNDAPGRTIDEVLAVFDKAIAAEEAKA